MGACETLEFLLFYLQAQFWAQFKAKFEVARAYSMNAVAALTVELGDLTSTEDHFICVCICVCVCLYVYKFIYFFLLMQIFKLSASNRS